MPSCTSVATYAPRRTAQSDLVRIVTEYGPKFIDQLAEAGTPLPDFVIRDFDALTRCGDLRHGFLRAACLRCGTEHLVPFSCKRRGFCPSCLGRRMAETSCLLVDHLLPAVRYRHFTCTFAGPLAVRLAYARPLLTAVMQTIGRRLDRDLRHRVKAEHRLPSVAVLHTGTVAVVQRFRFDLGLYLHVHALWTDGVFEDQGGSSPRWWSAPPLTLEGLQTVVARIEDDLGAVLQDDDFDASDLQGITACLKQGRCFSTASPSTMPATHGPLLAKGDFIGLHAAASFDGRDRKRLQRQLAYMLRPPVAMNNIVLQSDGVVRLHFKQPSPNGTTFTDLTPHAVLARLAALVPPPHFNMVRYRGVFSSRHHLRAALAFQCPNAPTVVAQLPLFERHGALELPAGKPARAPTPSRIAWAHLLARVFDIDITVCPNCHGRMKVFGAVTTPDAIAKVLARHGLRVRGPPPLPVATSAQLSFQALH